MRTVIMLIVVITGVIGWTIGSAAHGTVNKAMTERAEMLANI